MKPFDQEMRERAEAVEFVDAEGCEHLRYCPHDFIEGAKAALTSELVTAMRDALADASRAFENIGGRGFAGAALEARIDKALAAYERASSGRGE